MALTYLKKLTRAAFSGLVTRKLKGVAAAAQPVSDDDVTQPLDISRYQLEADEGMLSVRWSDGERGRFPFVWLRDNSPDSSTYHLSPTMKARQMSMNDLDPEVAPSRVALDGAAALTVGWPDGVESRFTSEWLRTRNLSDERRRQWRRRAYLNERKLWTSTEIGAAPVWFDYERVMTDERALHDWLLAVAQWGVGFLRGAPAETGVVQAIADRVGLLQPTHFGGVYDVMVKPDASNMAYAHTGELPMHLDFPSLQLSPDLQMLHFVKQAAHGGDSLFVDGFKVAQTLREEQPDAFHLLSTVPLEYIEEGVDQFDFFCLARHKIIKLDSAGAVEHLWYGNAMRGWFYDLPVEQIRPMYRAMKAFFDCCYRPEHLYEVRLQPGEVVLWANDRVLHARRAFDGGRHLQGCYFSWDFVKSRIRVARRQLQLPEDQPSA